MLNDKIKPLLGWSIDFNLFSNKKAVLVFSGADLSNILVKGENTITITGKLGDIDFEATNKLSVY